MIPAGICAAEGCENQLARRPGQIGRPAIYCSAACRRSHRRPALLVELEQEEDEKTGPGREWTVSLRRGNRVVVVGRGIGRLSAMALASELRSLLAGSLEQMGRQP